MGRLRTNSTVRASRARLAARSRGFQRRLGAERLVRVRDAAVAVEHVLGGDRPAVVEHRLAKGDLPARQAGVGFPRRGEARPGGEVRSVVRELVEEGLGPGHVGEQVAQVRVERLAGATTGEGGAQPSPAPGLAVPLGGGARLTGVTRASGEGERAGAGRTCGHGEEAPAAYSGQTGIVHGDVVHGVSLLYDGTSDRGGCACAAAGNSPAPGRSVAETARGYADTRRSLGVTRRYGIDNRFHCHGVMTPPGGSDAPHRPDGPSARGRRQQGDPP